MESGKLRHQLTIQQVAQASDGAGGFTESWTTYATTRADVRTNAGKEAGNGFQQESIASHIFKTRYVAGITTKMRIIFDSRVFNIVRVDNVKERNNWMEITCLENTEVTA